MFSFNRSTLLAQCVIKVGIIIFGGPQHAIFLYKLEEIYYFHPSMFYPKRGKKHDF